MAPAVSAGGYASKVPKTRISARLRNLTEDYLAAIGGFVQLFSLLLPWYTLGEVGGVLRPGPDGASLGVATAVAVICLLLTIFGAGIRNPAVIAVSALAQVIFLGYLASEAFVNAPATMSDPCPDQFPVRDYCNYTPPINGPGIGLLVAFGGAFISLVSGLRDVGPYTRRRRATRCSAEQTRR